MNVKADKPFVPSYARASPTTAEYVSLFYFIVPDIDVDSGRSVEYAELPIIDLSRDTSEESHNTLAQQARDAMREHGFVYVVNHGQSEAEIKRMFDIADVPFTQVGDQEKLKFEGRMETTGSFQGYKPRGYWHVDNGVRDQIETYNINRDVTRCQHPAALVPFLPEIRNFARHTHEKILHPILRLLATGLKLPKDTFVNVHNYSGEGETYARFMKYYPYMEEDELKANNVWLKGHTDMGSMTILYSQPVSALQIMTKGGTWKWIKHIENGVVVNVGDALEFLSGGYYKATIHRVVQPPPDQRGYPRLGVYYFAMTDDIVKLSPVKNSPVLERVGIVHREGYDAHAEPPTMAVWRKARTAAYGRSELRPATEEERVEEEKFGGVVVKHYN